MFRTISYDLWNKDPNKFSQELGLSFKESGFCAIKNHPINKTLIEEVMSLFKTFFSYSDKKKLTYYKKQLAGARGYTPFRVETPKDGINPDLKEFWHVGRELPDNHIYNKWMHKNLWVEDLSDFREKTLRLYKEYDDFGKTLLHALTLYLQIKENTFEEVTDYGNSIMRAIHYPIINNMSLGERAGAHEDINLITLLIGGYQPGLEILDSNQKWIEVNASHDTVICNIGDMMQRFTNNKLKSTTHRVRALSKESRSNSRYSFPFFLHPNPDWMIKTLENCITSKNPNLYPNAIMAEDFLRERLIEIKLT